MRLHRKLNDESKIETIVDHKDEEIIIAIQGHYKEVFAKAQTPALTDNPKLLISQQTKSHSIGATNSTNHTRLQE